MAQCIKCQIELSLHTTLKRLPESHTQWGFQTVMVGIFNDFCHIASPLSNMGSDIGHDFLVHNGITDTNAEPIVKKPVVDDFLNASEKLSSHIGSLSWKMTWIRPPCEAPTVFFSTIPYTIFNHRSIVEDRIEDLGSELWWILILRGIAILRICSPVQSGLGLMMAGIGITPSHSGTHKRMFWTWFQSRNVSRKVNLRIPHKVSWTIPIMGLFTCGKMIWIKRPIKSRPMTNEIITNLPRHPCDLTQLR